MLAAVDPVFAVTNPWKVVGPLLLPVSAVNGIFPKFVPPGTPTATVALYATPASLIATATTSNVAVEGSGQKLKLPLESATVCSKMTSVPVLSRSSNATRTLPFVPREIGCIVTVSTTCPLMPVLFVLTCPAVSTGFSRNCPLPC